MLKITAKLHLCFFTLLLAAVCAFEHRLLVFSLTYATMLVHEMSHLIAAKMIGLYVDCICLYPFGVNLKLKNKMVHSLADECILYLAGPLANAVMALVFLVLYGMNKSYICQFLYISNTALMVINLLPILPLDGGILLKKLLSNCIGEKNAKNVIKVFSVIIILALLAIFVYGVIITEFNFSILLLCVFLVGNLFVQEEKYDSDFVKKLVFKNKKRGVNHIICKNDDYRGLIRKFHNNKYNIVYYMDNDGHINKIMTEDEIFHAVLNNTDGDISLVSAYNLCR